LDVGIKGYQRYVGYGVLSYNLHVIGRELLARRHARPGGLTPPHLQTQTKPDRSSVAVVGEF
jgi:hypothetical protein